MIEPDKIDIHELLPQQEPFVMAGRLISYSDNVSVTITDITADNIFTEDGRFSAEGIIENMAQSCAARIGYHHKFILNEDVRIGFIGAIRNLTILRTPAVGSVIETEIRVMEEIFGMTLVAATVREKGEIIAEAEMKIALQPEK